MRCLKGQFKEDLTHGEAWYNVPTGGGGEPELIASTTSSRRSTMNIQTEEQHQFDLETLVEKFNWYKDSPSEHNRRMVIDQLNTAVKSAPLIINSDIHEVALYTWRIQTFGFMLEVFTTEELPSIDDVREMEWAVAETFDGHVGEAHDIMLRLSTYTTTG